MAGGRRGKVPLAVPLQGQGPQLEETARNQNYYYRFSSYHYDDDWQLAEGNEQRVMNYVPLRLTLLLPLLLFLRLPLLLRTTYYYYSYARPTTYDLLPTACYLLPTSYYLLPATDCYYDYHHYYYYYYSTANIPPLSAAIPTNGAPGKSPLSREGA